MTFLYSMGCDQSKAAGGPPGKGSAPTQQGNRAAARSTPAKVYIHIYQYM